MSFHKSLPVGEIHPIQNWSVADTTALNALVVVAEDIGKVAAKIDDATFWVLANNVGPVWKNATQGTGLSNPMTTAGDIIYGGTPVAGVAPATRLAAGTAGTVLTSNGPGVAPSYQAALDVVPNMVLADWTWVNQLTSSAVVTGSRMLFLSDATSGDSWNILKKTQTLTAGQTFRINLLPMARGAATANQGCGLILRESGTGKFCVFQWQPAANAAGGAFTWSNPTTFLGTVVSFPNYSPKIPVKVLQATYSGTQWSFAWSFDGSNYHSEGPFTIASFTPNEIGFGTNPRAVVTEMNIERTEVF